MNELESSFTVLENAKANHFVGTGKEHQIFAQAVGTIARAINQLATENKNLHEKLNGKLEQALEETPKNSRKK